jgi:serine/threonine protein kinase
MLTDHGSKGFKERFCARLVSDMLAAVRYLHDRGVVHRYVGYSRCVNLHNLYMLLLPET